MRAAKARRSYALDDQMEDPAPGASTLNGSILLPGPDDENSSSSDKSSMKIHSGGFKRCLPTLVINLGQRSFEDDGHDDL